MYPINLDLRGKRAIVVGGGPVAERKVRGLIEAGAAVAVISPVATPGLEALAARAAIVLESRAYRAGDLTGAVLAFAATDDDAVNASVVEEARAAAILVDDATAPERGDFSTPAVHRTGPLVVAVDSGGIAPSLAVRARDEIARTLDPAFGQAATTLGRMREYVRTALPRERRADVMRVLTAADVGALAAMNPVEAENAVEHAVDDLERSSGARLDAPITPLVCASRGSLLAMTQTRTMVARLAEAGFASTILTISTKGDTVTDRSLAAIGTDSIFVKELETALRERRADYAVHSCKDLPSSLPEDMCLAAITTREDARDAFCSERWPTFASLPSGARVGTSSPRRRAQLRALRPDLVYDDIRGNVDTRLRKLVDGEFDATVLALAGLHRLGKRATYTVPFSAEEMVPAVGQGALALETRIDVPLASDLDRIVGDPSTTIAVTAERAFLRTLRGGCQAPVGAHGVVFDGTLHLVGAVAEPDGSHVYRAERRSPASLATADATGVALAQELLAAGAGAALPADNGVRGPLLGRIFLLPRTQDRPSRIAPALRSAGADVIEARDSAAARGAFATRVPDAILFPSSGSVEAIAEYLGSLRENGHRPIVVAMGPSSSERAETSGFPPDVIAPDADVASFVQAVTRYVLERTT